MKPPRSVLLRDGAIFLLKLWLDGLKDVVLTATALGAILIDLVRGKNAQDYLFYRVIRAGERFDLWLNLYGAAGVAGRSEEGFFGASRAGEDTLLGRLEKLTGGERGRRPPHSR